MQKIISIIPARGGSKGLKNKNIRDLYGKPLISWSINFAKKSNLIDDCIVSTDCDEIAQIAQKFGARVPFKRDKFLSDDKAKTSDVLLDVIDKCKLNKDDTIILLEPTSPYRLHKDLQKIVEIFFSNKFSKIVSVQEAISSSYKFQFFQNNNLTLRSLDYLEMPNDIRRQDIKKTFFLDGSFYMSYISEFKKEPGFLGNNTGSFLNNYFSSFEIDCMDDLILMEAIFKTIGPPF